MARGAGEDLSARMLAATGRGFWRTEQQGLLAGYVARFYPADLAPRRGDVIAEVLGTDAYLTTRSTTRPLPLPNI